MREIKNELVDVEERLSDLLHQCSLDSFVSVDTIKRWMKDMNDEDPITSVNMLSGLLDKEKLVDVDLFQDLITRDKHWTELTDILLYLKEKFGNDYVRNIIINHESIFKTSSTLKSHLKKIGTMISHCKGMLYVDVQ